MLIQIEPDGHWRMMLADFGVARGAGYDDGATQVTGTFAYMAPEQFSGKFSPATDQYALAVIDLSTAGRPPAVRGRVGRLTRAHLYETPPSLRQFNPAVTPQMEAAILRATGERPGAAFPQRHGICAGARRGGAWCRCGCSTRCGTSGRSSSSAGASATVAGRPRRREDRTEAARRPGAALVGRVGGGSPVDSSDWRRSVLLESAAAERRTCDADRAGSGGADPAGAGLAIRDALATASASTTTTVGPTATTAPTTPPSGVGSAAFTSLAPTCDGQSSPAWTKVSVTVTCVSTTQVDLSSPQAGSLACLSAQAVSQPNGYVQARADPQSGKVEVGVRQGVGNTTTGNSYYITGYYLGVNLSTSQYVIWVVDASGVSTTLQQGQLTATPPHPFTFGLMFNGTSLTPYINGQAYASVTDSAFSTGWTAICTDGSGTFSGVQLYQLAS